ncbi:MAE_28990/MAE_18760 family HEPN-like nuclease [Rhodopseudomonas sp. BR0G17]|uniref:MAE_28990/MAE_18760 family HEPN-like nuclease n=1 Tax=Rhodopseudomonas sp. BR0G17 TaxID=2269368 RepID=UPI0013DF16DF|nr:MAE_28990/MAE_18760 family HEPN-like nuclease [Rhodopseudomonas sp. BR0G17]NEW97169.1 hypothetical protein [Rhodopseudomonas sp. BR0G17]
MTYAFLQDFSERKRHVLHYLAVVRKAEREIRSGASRVEEGRLLTLRAGTFLVLYNLIEATFRGGIQEINDTITRKSVAFADLRVSLRRETIRRFKKQASPALNHNMVDLPCEFVSIALAGEIWIEGSVDAKRIAEAAGHYGFSVRTDNRRTRGGADLLTIKDIRHDLAHGRKTFEEVGRDHPIRQLTMLSDRSLKYMSGIAQNIAGYLDSEEYRELATEESEAASAT